jgi:hypothetical protein
MLSDNSSKPKAMILYNVQNNRVKWRIVKLEQDDVFYRRWLKRFVGAPIIMHPPSQDFINQFLKNVGFDTWPLALPHKAQDIHQKWVAELHSTYNEGFVHLVSAAAAYNIISESKIVNDEHDVQAFVTNLFATLGIY